MKNQCSKKKNRQDPAAARKAEGDRKKDGEGVKVTRGGTKTFQIDGRTPIRDPTKNTAPNLRHRRNQSIKKAGDERRGTSPEEKERTWFTHSKSCREQSSEAGGSG